MQWFIRGCFVALVALTQSVSSLAPDNLSRRALGAAAISTTAGTVGAANAAKPPTPEVATDRRGKPIVAASWEAEHASGQAGELIAGLGGEPTMLLLDDEGKLRDYALFAECTHLGCLVGPWNPLSQRFVCPCHGSEYKKDGTVARGPAPKPLRLAKVGTDDQGRVTVDRWTDADFRTSDS